MGETARPLGIPDEPSLDAQPTPTPTPVSGVMQSIRLPEVEAIGNHTGDLLGAALDELGIEPSKNDGPITLSIDPTKISAMADTAKEKLHLRSTDETKAKLSGTSFNENPTPEIPDHLQSAAE